jgi:hypothetical protein
MNVKRRDNDDLFEIEPIDGVTSPAAPLVIPANDNRPSSRQLDKFVTEALAIEHESAQEAGAFEDRPALREYPAFARELSDHRGCPHERATSRAG